MNWAYVAGFFDGEGNVGAYPPINATYCWGLRITIAQTLAKEGSRRKNGTPSQQRSFPPDTL